MYADDCLVHVIGNNWKRMVPRKQEGLFITGVVIIVEHTMCRKPNLW